MITVARNQAMNISEGPFLANEMDEAIPEFALEVEVPFGKKEPNYHHHLNYQERSWPIPNNISPENQRFATALGVQSPSVTTLPKTPIPVRIKQPKSSVASKGVTERSSTTPRRVLKQEQYCIVNNRPSSNTYTHKHHQNPQQHIHNLSSFLPSQDLSSSIMPLPKGLKAESSARPLSKKLKKNSSLEYVAQRVKNEPTIEHLPKRMERDFTFESSSKLMKKNKSSLKSFPKDLKQVLYVQHSTNSKKIMKNDASFTGSSKRTGKKIPPCSIRRFHQKPTKPLENEESVSSPSSALQMSPILYQTLQMPKKEIQFDKKYIEVDFNTQSSSCSSYSSSSSSNNSTSSSCSNRENMLNMHRDNNNNATNVVSNNKANKKWGKFFMGRERKKYIRQKQLKKKKHASSKKSKSPLSADGESPEENLAHVIVNIEFKRGGLFYDRRQEVYDLIHKQYNKSQAGNRQNPDNDENTSNNILRMKFPSEDPTAKRAKEHEYLDLICLPEFKEFENDSQLWACIDELFGAQSNGSCNDGNVLNVSQDY